MSDSNENIKQSIHLPKTEFPMRGNLPKKEPQMIESWLKKDIYQKMLLSAQKGRFGYQDGPPYANGNIHMGHTLNKCLKDFVIKSKNMAGYSTEFIPGWDCHGLPIEHNITKKLGSKIKEKSNSEIRSLCREEAKSWVEKQKEQFQRLGILSDWENPYLTLDPAYEAEEVREFARILKNGVIYQGHKPVYWCIPLQTALAEAEVEYKNHRSPSIYVRFSLTVPRSLLETSKPINAMIWTTTPWTLPANRGLAVHPDFKYGFFESGDEIILLATDLKESVEKACDLDLGNLIKEVNGKDLENLQGQHCWYDRPSPVVLGDHVTLETGTGIVHTAPGHGQEDYIVGQAYNLPLTSPVKPDGTYNEEVPEYEGTLVWKANPLIVEDLKKRGRLAGYSEFDHSYPHCWRSGAPLIFRATSQWFISMDNKNFPIRQKALKALEDIEFVPAWGRKRLKAMIENRPDWCLSRQRNWGVPLPIFYCENCDTPLLSESAIEKVANAMEKEGGLEAYYAHSPQDFLESETTCEHCQGKAFRHGHDILDVWFDSGVSHGAVQKKRPTPNFPADLYLEGSDQHRGWFQTSLISSIASTGQPPFKSLLTHNFVNDEKGHKMSKSRGNVTDPLKLVKQSGAEILRLWTASQDYGQDMNFSEQGFQRVKETYRRLRNTTRFLLGNLNDFDEKSQRVAIADMPPLDQWILDRSATLFAEIQGHYEKFEFFKIYQSINQYFTVDLSAHYLDLIKDRLYTGKKDGLPRKSAQTVIFDLTNHLIRLLAPITSFLAEEAYGHFPTASQESIFLENFLEVPESWRNPTLSKDYTDLFELRSAVSKELEQLRVAKTIGSSLEASVSLQVPEALSQLLQKYESGMREFFIISDFSYDSTAADTSSEGLEIKVQKAEGEKCPRCWHIAPLEELDSFGKVCPKCIEAL